MNIFPRIRKALKLEEPTDENVVKDFNVIGWNLGDKSVLIISDEGTTEWKNVYRFHIDDLKVRARGWATDLDIRFNIEKPNRAEYYERENLVMVY